MTVLLTGATGFIGSAVVRKLLARGEAVRVTVRTGSDVANLEGLKVERVRADLNDHESLRKAITGCRQLYHLAADYRLWAPRPAELYAANVEGTRALMLAALDAGVERVIYTSSVATLGFSADGTPATEDTPVTLAEMIGPYKRSKFLAEEVVSKLVRKQGLPAVIVNPSAPVGPRDRKPTPTGQMILEAATGRMPAFVDSGLNIVHVDDVADGHLLAADKGEIGRRYILGSENLSLREIFTAVAVLGGQPPPRLQLPITPLMPLAWLAQHWARLSGGTPRLTLDGLRLARKPMYFSCSRACGELGYAPRPAAAALADAVEWFLR